MKRSFVLVLILIGVVGCNQTTVMVLTEAPLGRTANLNVETGTLTVTRGLAVALECSAFVAEIGDVPCRNLSIAVGDSSLAEVLPVHLDTLERSIGDPSAGTVLVAPTERSGAVLAAKSVGTTTLDVTSDASPVQLTLVVLPP